MKNNKKTDAPVRKINIRRLALDLLESYEAGERYVNLLLTSPAVRSLSDGELSALTALLYTSVDMSSGRQAPSYISTYRFLPAIISSTSLSHRWASTHPAMQIIYIAQSFFHDCSYILSFMLTFVNDLSLFIFNYCTNFTIFVFYHAKTVIII